MRPPRRATACAARAGWRGSSEAISRSARSAVGGVALGRALGDARRARRGGEFAGARRAPAELQGAGRAGRRWRRERQVRGARVGGFDRGVVEFDYFDLAAAAGGVWGSRKVARVVGRRAHGGQRSPRAAAASAVNPQAVSGESLPGCRWESSAAVADSPDALSNPIARPPYRVKPRLRLAVIGGSHPWLDGVAFCCQRCWHTPCSRARSH